MPTLLNVNNYHYRRGGADVMYLEQSALFRSIGWGVAEMAMAHPENLPSEWSPYFIDEIEFGHGYSATEQLVRVGRVVYSRQAQQRLEELLRVARPDVAHLHNIYHHLSPSVLPVLHRHGVPTVLTTHDLKLACPAYRMVTHDGICERCKGGRIYNVVRHRCIKDSAALSSVILLETAVQRTLGLYRRHVDRFVSPSRFYIRKFGEWGIDTSRFVYIPNYVRPQDFHPATDTGHGVVYFGRLAPEKGLHTLVRAAAIADVPVRIAGTGPEVEPLARLIEQVGADVELVGFRSGRELHDLVRGARATVLPSEWYENAPVSVLESYALGRPVLGARIGGIEELVRPDETGLTFAPDDPDALAAVLRQVHDAPDALVAEWGRTGRTWVEQEFTDRLWTERMLALYAELGVPG